MPISINGSGAITGVTNYNIPDNTITPEDLTQKLTLMAAQNATGTAVDFTGIPSWAKRITVMFDGVSTNGVSAVAMRLGTSLGVASSGYNSQASTVNGTVVATNFSTTLLVLEDASTAAFTRHGAFVLANLTGNVWVMQGGVAVSGGGSARTSQAGGSVTLAGALDRIRATTANGTDAFDGGTIGVLYEG